MNGNKVVKNKDLPPIPTFISQQVFGNINKTRFSAGTKRSLPNAS